MNIHKFSINVGDVLVGIGCVILMSRDQPLPVIVILLARAISELCHIRSGLDAIAANSINLGAANTNKGGEP